MPGLSFSSQSQNGRPGFWWIPVVLIVISVMLITLYVRLEGGGPFAVARGAVQTVTKPIENVCSIIAVPFRNIGESANNEQIAKLEQENTQLRTLVAELEEYRQQDQRLTTMSQLADIYGLETLSGEVMTTSGGWDRTATVNKGSQDGVRVGMGVMSSCGLYGQVESVTSNTCTVRIINDANSSVSAMVQNSRAHGIMHGAFDGTLTLEYVPVDKSVGKGDIVITSGSGGTYPRGIVIGTVRSVETDSSKLYHRITVDPIYSLDSCEEVLILTGNESETASIIDEALLQSIIDSANTVHSSTSSALGIALLNSAKERSRPMQSGSSSSASTSTSAGTNSQQPNSGDSSNAGEGQRNNGNSSTENANAGDTGQNDYYYEDPAEYEQPAQETNDENYDQNNDEGAGIQ